MTSQTKKLMEPDELEKAEDKLFRHWQQSVPAFVRDGAMKHYARQSLRVLFVLKEGTVGGDDLREVALGNGKFRGAGYGPTWHKLVRWTALIHNRRRLQQISRQDWQRYLQRIAVVNVKKSAGRTGADSVKVLNTIKSRKQADLLKQQLRLYRPHITICGGDLVGTCLNMVYCWTEKEWKKHKCTKENGEHEIWYRQSPELGYVISFWHPNQRSFTQERLLNILGELVSRFTLPRSYVVTRTKRPLPC